MTFFLKGEYYSKCERSMITAMELFNDLGYVIHPEKSVFLPAKIITFLGFEINSQEMTVELSTEKKHLKGTNFCRN